MKEFVNGPQDIIHHPHECRWSISQAKRHDQPLKEAFFIFEGCLPYWYCSRYIIVVLPLLAKYLCSAYYIISGILQVVSELFSGKNLWGNFFFMVQMYSDVFKLQRSIVLCINPQ
jgi:hypothetical protein